MAVRIRLKRLGKKKKPFYRLVIANSTTPRGGKTIEDIGMYDPTKEPNQFIFKEDRLTYWLSVGAQPSEPVQRLLSSVGVLPKLEKVAKEPGVSKKEKRERQAEAA